MHTQSTCSGFNKKHIGVNADAIDLRGNIIDGNISGATTLRRCNKVSSPLVVHPNEIWPHARRIE